MSGELIAAGLVQLLVGLVVGVVGVVVAWRALRRFLRLGREAGPEASSATATLAAGAIVALGLIARPHIEASGSVLAFLRERRSFGPRLAGDVTLYSLGHLGVTLAVGAAILAVGAWAFNRLTPEVDEVSEVRRGNLPSAIVLAAILVVLALLTAPGLEALLTALIPFPELPEGTLRTPS